MSYVSSRAQRYHREQADGNKAWSRRLVLIGQGVSAGNGGVTPSMQKAEVNMVVIGSVPCRVALEVHLNDQ
jgi:hypothetical protein